MNKNMKYLLMIDYGVDGWALVDSSDDFEYLRSGVADEFYESGSNGSLIIVTRYLQCGVSSDEDTISV